MRCILFCVVVQISVIISAKGRAVWIDDNPSTSDLREFESFNEFLLDVLSGHVSITSDSMVYLLSGDHNVHVTVKSHQALVIRDIANFSIEVGHTNETTNQLSTANVFCHTKFGLSFINITNLRIFGIHFKHCGVVSNSLSLIYTLKVADSFNVLICNVTISKSTGIGLLLQNVYTNLSLSRLQLIGNAINCYIQCCWYSSSDINVTETSYMIEHSDISFGRLCSRSICKSSSSGLTVALNQTSFVINFITNNVTFQDNQGQGNILVNTTSCCGANVITFSHIKSLFSEAYDKPSYGLAYHELQCSRKGPLPRNVSISHSHLITSCIYTKLYDNLGLVAGVSETHISIHNTSITGSLCKSSLEIHNIHYVTMNNVKISNGESPFIIRAVNKLKYKTGYYSIRLLGLCTFNNNKGGISITGVHSQSSTRLIFTEESNTVIRQNKVLNFTGNQFGATLYISDVVVQVFAHSNVMFIQNQAVISGGITATRSDVQFIGNSNLEFDGNIGRYGGAIALYDKSQLSFYRSNTTITFINNLAQYYGGAMFVDDSSYLERITNIFTAPFFSLFCCSPRLEFRMNKAGLGGSALYGGWIDWINHYRKFLRIEANISHFFYIDHHEGDSSQIASEPTRICVCQDRKPNCSRSELQYKIYPGESFSVTAAAVGQRYGTVTSRVEARFDGETEVEESTRPKLGELERIQIVDQGCTSLKYSPRSSNNVEKLSLTVSNSKNIIFADKTISELEKDPVYHLHFQQLSVKVEFQPCPFGFIFNKSTQLCACTQLPNSYNVYCDSYKFQLIRQDTTWVGSVNELGNASSMLIFGTCPFDYCNSTNVALTLEGSDKQCNFHRSGVLCGGCKQNLSIVFGSSACQDCSSSLIAPLVVGFALAGVCLIVVLLVLNLTISTGTINSLIFYANIVNISTWSFIPISFSDSFLYKFVSVLNFGVGSKLCFYQGMTAYGKAWLFFAFPSYILILSILVIVISHYSIKASKLLGKNSVQVLATLFLLSYAKFLEITIATSAFGFSILQSADAQIVRHVWLLDGNVAYLSGKHALLFIATLLLVLLVCVPYTLLLVLVQPLQKYSHIHAFGWIHKLKPFTDAHTGPYKDKHHYWTGLLLLVRAGLAFLLTLNRHGNQLINTALITVVTLCLIFYILLVRGVYKSRLLNVVEVSFMINLFIMSAALLLQEIFNSHYQQLSLWIVNISVGVAFLYFCLILIYHTVTRICTTVLGKWVKEVIIKPKLKTSFSKLVSSDNTRESKSSAVSDIVTHSSIELREPLLLSDD